MTTYAFEDNAIFYRRDKADPQVIGEALEELARQHGGRLRPEHAVEVARKRNHPFHRHFEWNDATCGIAYRLEQARALIRSVKIIAHGELNEASARAYHSIQDDGRAYRSVSEIETSAMLQLSLHRAALRDLIAWENRYRSIATICPLVSVARERLQETVETLQPSPSPARRKASHESRPSA